MYRNEDCAAENSVSNSHCEIAPMNVYFIITVNDNHAIAVTLGFNTILGREKIKVIAAMCTTLNNNCNVVVTYRYVMQSSVQIILSFSMTPIDTT